LRKAIFFSVVALATSFGLLAQTTSPPSTIASSPGTAMLDPTQIVAALGQDTVWTKWADASMTVLGQKQAVDEAALKVLTDQSAAIAALKTQLTADETRITALETKLAALATKTVTAGTTLATP
jgi:ribosomal protein L16 Arg81 hydroxylase